MAINEWSTVAANNASGVTGVNWAEGQAPSTVNDSARAVMADVAAWYGQAKIPEYLTSVSGTNTVVGTGPASMSAYAAGQRFTFLQASNNSGATTLNITPSGGAALGAKNIFWNGVALVGGELRANVPATVIYDGTQFHLLSSASYLPAHQQITSSLGADVALNSTGAYFTGPSVAQGTSGTWFASGQVTISNANGDTYNIKLWDGTTVIDSCQVSAGAAVVIAPTLSGYLASPAGNIRISVSPVATTTGNIKFNASGNSKDSTITAFKVSN